MLAIRIHGRTLLAAAIVALAAVSGPAVHAHAQPSRTNDGQVYCTATRADGEIEFFLPGEIVTDVNGVRHICASDGNFYRMAISVAAPTHSSGPAGEGLPEAGVALGS